MRDYDETLLVFKEMLPQEEQEFDNGDEVLALRAVEGIAGMQ